MPEDVSFFEGYEQVLVPLFNASNVLSLVGRADEAGLVSALREPRDVPAAAAVTGLPVDTVRTLCRALAASGVVSSGPDGYQLLPAWRAVTDPGAFVPLAGLLAGHRVESRMMRGETYWDVSSEDRIAYARSVSPDPFSDELVASFRAEAEADPVQSAMKDGGRYLELGCGVAGRILTTLRAFPALTAVGVEVSADLAAAARSRADELGLGDRFEVVCTDAAGFRAAEPFDFGFWSQFFFPAASRADALRVLHDSVRSGGTVWAPVFGFHDRMAAEPDGLHARDYAVMRVVLDGWGVPERTDDELVAEVAAAGFTDVHVIPRNGSFPAVQATRP